MNRGQLVVTRKPVKLSLRDGKQAVTLAKGAFIIADPANPCGVHATRAYDGQPDPVTPTEGRPNPHPAGKPVPKADTLTGNNGVIVPGGEEVNYDLWLWSDCDAGACVVTYLFG